MSFNEKQRRYEQKGQNLVCNILVAWAPNTSYLSIGRTKGRQGIDIHLGKKNERTSE
jgi:hypothetical protein